MFPVPVCGFLSPATRKTTCRFSITRKSRSSLPANGPKSPKAGSITCIEAAPKRFSLPSSRQQKAVIKVAAIKTVLTELRELVRGLADDLLARSTSDAKINAGLKQAFHQIEKGGRTAQAFEVWREDYLDQVAVAW